MGDNFGFKDMSLKDQPYFPFCPKMAIKETVKVIGFRDSSETSVDSDIRFNGASC